jgi:hypothetical protein
MKCKSKLQRWLVAGALSLSLGGWALSGLAQTYPSYIIDQFDTDSSGSYYNQYWGSTAPSLAWNTNNCTPPAGYPNNAGSGSLEWQSDWVTSGGDQIMVEHWFANGTNLNFNDYTNLMFDIQFQTNCATDGNGSYGFIEIDAMPSLDGWASTYLGGYTSEVSNGNGWIHVSLPIATQGNSKLSSVNGFGIKLQQSKTGPALTGTTDFLIDNLILGGNSVPPPPPNVALSPVTSPPGLLFVIAGGGNEWNRAELQANGNAYSWLGASGPVTYSMTIVGYPDPTYQVQSEIFLVPNGSSQDPSIDWDAATAATLTIKNNSDGSATGVFSYKVNDLGDNSGYTNLNMSITTTTPLGTWSLTFEDDTNVTLSGPGNLSVSTNFASEAAAQVFANPLMAYFGNMQCGSTAEIGQGSTYSQFTISNAPAAATFTDVFTNDSGVINYTSQWIDDDPPAPNNILIVQAADPYWLSWTLPAEGYNVLSSPTLGPSAVWSSAGLTNVVTTANGNKVLVTSDSLPAAKAGFFILGKPTQ